MRVSELIKPIKVSLKSRMLVALGVVVTGLMYCYSDEPVTRLVSIISLLFLTEALILLWVPQFVDVYKFSLMSLFKKTLPVEQRQTNEFDQLLQKTKVKLNKKKPISIQVGLNNAYTMAMTSRIVLGDVLLSKLTSTERQSLVAHELAHMKLYHPVKMMIWIMFVPMLIYSLASATSPAPIVSGVMYAAAFALTFVCVSWWNELSADRLAAKLTGVSETISLLKKITPEKEWNVESITHPPISFRIKRLKTLSQKCLG